MFVDVATEIHDESSVEFENCYIKNCQYIEQDLLAKEIKSVAKEGLVNEFWTMIEELVEETLKTSFKNLQSASNQSSISSLNRWYWSQYK